MAEMSTSDIDLDDESYEANEPPKKKNVTNRSITPHGKKILR